MFVLRLSIWVQVSKKIFGINKWEGGGGPNKHWGCGLEKNQKLTSGKGGFIWHSRK